MCGADTAVTASYLSTHLFCSNFLIVFTVYIKQHFDKSKLVEWANIGYFEWEVFIIYDPIGQWQAFSSGNVIIVSCFHVYKYPGSNLVLL